MLGAQTYFQFCGAKHRQLSAMAVRLLDLPADLLQHLVIGVLRGAWQAYGEAGARFEALPRRVGQTSPDEPDSRISEDSRFGGEDLEQSKISVVEAGLQARALAGIVCTCRQLCDLLGPAMRRGGLVCNAQCALGGCVAAGMTEPDDWTALPACYIPDTQSALAGVRYGRQDPHAGCAAAMVAMAVRADGRLCATVAVSDTDASAEGPTCTEVRLYSLPDCQLQCSMSATPGVAWTCVALEGSCVIGGDSSGGLQVWALSGGSGSVHADALYQLQGHEAEMVRLAISPDGRFLASSSWSLCLRWQATLRIWSLPSGSSLAVEERTDPDYCIAWAGDLGLVTESQGSLGLELWSPVDAEQAPVLMPHPASVLSIAIQRPEDLSSTRSCKWPQSASTTASASGLCHLDSASASCAPGSCVHQNISTTSHSAARGS